MADGPDAYQIADLRARRGTGSTAFNLLIPKLTIGKGARTAFIGPSGCGKSTLLELLSLTGRARSARRFLLGGLDGPVEASAALVDGRSSYLARLRGRNIGCVPQNGALLSYANVARNVMISRRLQGLGWDRSVDDLLARLGLTNHTRKLPGDLSAGERQRVALARALAHHPLILVADEPTAALDPDNADTVMALIGDIVCELGVTAILATHDRDRAARFGFTPVPFFVGDDPQDGSRSSMCAN